MTYGPNNSLGAFLPINQTFSEDEKQRLIQLTNRDRDIARYLNVREIGIHDQVEVVNGQQWFGANAQTKRDAYRQVYSCPAVAAGVTATIPHGISTITTFTLISASVVTDAPDYRPVPYASTSALNKQIEIRCDNTNIYLINGAGGPNIVTGGVIILEYLKN